MKVNIQAGTPEAPSIAVALENYLKASNKNWANTIRTKDKVKPDSGSE
jgi:hypothetical protein